MPDEIGRIPAHLEVTGLVRAVGAAGGFATVLAKGERDAGTLMLVLLERGGPARALERMPQADGTRAWQPARLQDVEDPKAFWDYIERRHKQDPDLWVLELDVAGVERFIA